MVEENSVLCVADFDTQSVSRERSLVASGIGVATVAAPEAAITYVKNSRVRVVLLDDTAAPELSELAGALKVARPTLRVIALVNSSEPIEHVDTVLRKPVELQDLLAAVYLNLSERDAASA